MATPDELTTTDREEPALEYSQTAYIPTDDASAADLTIDLDGAALHFARVDETLTIDQPRQRQRQTDETAPAPQRFTRPAKWHEMAYRETYHYHDLELTGEPRETAPHLPNRATFQTQDGALTCYIWEWFSITDVAAPPILVEPAPDVLDAWLEQYNASASAAMR